jgi:hypothetical protein
VTVLLTPATLIFNPEYIILPVLFIWKLYGRDYLVRYIMSILFGLSLSLFLKNHIRRLRPKVVEGLKYKPSYLRRKEGTYSMPSGDSIQGGILLYSYLRNYDENEGTSLNYGRL